MSKLADPKTKASFIEPMLALSASSLPEGSAWEYELKLDGYRALAIKTGRHVQLRSRNNKDFNGRFPGVVAGLRPMPNETVIDGEVVALDDSGRPSFNTLQNYAAGHPIFYYAFDLLILEGRDLRSNPLSERRELLRSEALSKLEEPIRYSPTLDGRLAILSNRCGSRSSRVSSRSGPTARMSPVLDSKCASTGVRSSSSAAIRRPKQLLCTCLRLLRS
jgi:ATP-dependent DNA ligase